MKLMEMKKSENSFRKKASEPSPAEALISGDLCYPLKTIKSIIGLETGNPYGDFNLTLHWEALIPKVRQVITGIKGTSIFNDFYLGGGTGLAFQIGHRLSVDIDLFSGENLLISQDRYRLFEMLSKEGLTKVVSEEDGTLKLDFQEVILSFFHYPYPLVTSLVEAEGLKIASLPDIGLMKIAAIIGRGTKKDFVDLYFVTKEGSSLEELLRLGTKKFSHVRDFKAQSLKALVYFEDAETQRLPKTLRFVAWKEVKRYFKDEVSKLIKKELCLGL